MGWGNGNIVKFKGQSYGKLRRKYMESNELFTDPLFPANENSLGLGRQLPNRVVWKRPTELTDTPHLFVEKASSKDVTQGRLGNCWLVAACAALTTVKELWKTVVPDYKLQEWDPIRPEQYCGIFHFRFWRTGKWIDVVVDDLLPTIDGQLIFCHSMTSNEFWSALLEKAYAKLCGSYGALDGGNLCDALIDFTSGIGEMITLKDGYSTPESKEKLRKQLLRAYEDHALMCSAISTSDPSLFESRTRTGLVIGHAYGITSVKEINIGTAGLLSMFKSGEKLTLLRLRNPWGQKEWSGAFSDGSPEWMKIPKSEKEKLGLVFEDDGEFWIPYEDFVAEFTDLSICQLVNTSIFSFRKTWDENSVSGQWTRPHRAGGCPNHDTFLKNPQYFFDIPKDDVELMIQIIQTDRREARSLDQNSSSNGYNSIGFHIMKVEANREHRLHKLQPKAVTSDYCKTRSMFYQGNLDEGRYVVVPTTFEPGVETEFLMRFYSDAAITLKELTNDYPEPNWMCAAFCQAPTCVTVITVEGASGLKADATYCIIKVEGEKLRSHTVENSYNPEWNLKGIFFRRDVCKPIAIELWENKKLQRDHFLGNAIITGAADNQLTTAKAPLVGRGDKQSEQHPGELRVKYVTYSDLDAA